MARKRHAKHDEVLLIPFLDILCSLIGVLILIIVVVCVAQTQKVRGRTKEDLQLAQQYQALLHQQQALEQAAAGLKAKLAAAEKHREDLDAKQRKLVELRKRLTLNADTERADKEKAAQIQKGIEDLLAQIETLARAVPPLQAELDALKKKLAERQKKPDAKPPSVVVRPSGSGSGQGRPLYFVEAGGGGIVFHKGKSERVRVAQASVGQDPGYNAFLQAVKDRGNASLIFLVRKDGWYTYQRAAGWAEQSFGLTTGKLPIPGDGTIDLSLFEKP